MNHHHPIVGMAGTGNKSSRRGPERHHRDGANAVYVHHRADGRPLSIYDLHFYDIMVPLVLPCLNYRDWLSLRCVSKQMYNRITEFFVYNKVLDFNPVGTEHIFTIMTKHARNLRYLNLANTTWVTDSILRPVIQRNKHLISIDLSNCSNCSQGIFQVITVNCPMVRRLVFRSCGWVKHDAVEYHASHHVRLSKNRVLTPHIDSPQDALAVFGNFGLRSKPKERKKSRYTGKDDLFKVMQNQEDVLRIKKKHRKRHLTLFPSELLEVDFSYNIEVNDRAMMVFFHVFKNIRSLSLEGNVNLSNETAKYAAKYLKDLVVINLSFMPKVTDRGVYTVARHCPKLKTMYLINCPGATPKILSYLAFRNIRAITHRLEYDNMLANRMELKALASNYMGYKHAGIVFSPEDGTDSDTDMESVNDDGDVEETPSTDDNQQDSSGDADDSNPGDHRPQHHAQSRADHPMGAANDTDTDQSAYEGPTVQIFKQLPRVVGGRKRCDLESLD